jgi:hypothetical protein
LQAENHVSTVNTTAKAIEIGAFLVKVWPTTLMKDMNSCIM